MAHLDKIVVPQWYRDAKKNGMSPADLNQKLHDHCREALLRRGDGSEPSEELIALTAEMYEHALMLREGDA